MGHQFSKSLEESNEQQEHPPCPTSSQQQLKTLDNDGLSRATALTGDESVSPPPSPSVAMFAHSQRWRQGATNPAVAAVRNTTSQQQQQQQEQLRSIPSKRNLTKDGHFQTYLVRRDSDPGRRADASGRQSMQPQRSEPVKCPRRKIQSVCEGSSAAIPPEEDHGVDASYLERMYDSRTWEMYRRITEARKQSKTKYSPTNEGGRAATTATTSLDQHMGRKAHIPRVGSNEEEWENLQHEEGDENDQCGMVFLFDF